ncbi:MAG: carbamate kinase [Candidatus Aureabacteria bacterium]|nr:carbamate kinase [Candidatus Auribacterota bacterium]
MRKTIVIALGGNAIKQADEKGTAEEQFKNVQTTCAQLVSMLKFGHRLVITHGNGPQAGNLLIQQEAAVGEIPPQPLDICGAMTQGQIGYMFQQTMQNMLWKEKLPLPVVSIVNQVLVSEDDPDYQDPTKPVGPFYAEAEAAKIKKERPDYVIKEVKPKSVEKRFRRVVPSPDPIRNIEYIAIRRMVDAGIVVIASGGGGVPVVYDKNENLRGTAAVIDKDKAGARLAEVVGADMFLVLTDVDAAKINYGTPQEKAVRTVTLSEMKKLHKEGHFKAGSMGPKVLACMRFIEWGGECAIITSLDKAVDALVGKAGTRVVPDPVKE